MALGLATTTRNNRSSSLNTDVGASAKLRFYSGARPATGGAVTTLLAELTCNATAFGTASGGVLTVNAVTAANASSTGTATWFRVVTSALTFVFDGDVNTTSSDLNVTSTSFVSGQQVSVTSWTLTEGNV